MPWDKKTRYTTSSALNTDSNQTYRDVDFEAILNVVENFGIGFIGDESDGEAFGSKSAGTCNL